MRNKRIIFTVTRKYMLQNKKRTITTWIGIALMVMMLTCVFVGKDTIFSYLVSVASLKNGSWHATVYDVDSEQYEQIKALPYVEKTAISKDLGFSDFAASASDEKPFVEIKAYAPDNFRWMNISLVEGCYPENESQILISKTALDEGADIQIGDTISADFFERYIKKTDADSENVVFPFYNMTLKNGETKKLPQDFPYYGANTSFEEIHEQTGNKGTYEVVGIMEPPSYEKEHGSFYAALAGSKNEVGQNDKVNVCIRFDLHKLSGGYVDELHQIMDDQEDAVEINDMVMVFSQNSSENSLNLLVRIVMVFFVLLIVVISVILIYNVFHISFRERLKYLGMLSSIGATGRQRRSSVYYEAFLLLLIALPAGFVMGLVVVKAGMKVLDPYILKLLGSMMAGNYVGTDANLCIQAKNVIEIILIAVFTVGISALYPAMRVGKMPILYSAKGAEKVPVKPHKTNCRFMNKNRTLAALAHKNIRFQNAKTKSIVRSIAVFIILLTVTTFGARAVTKMVHFRLVDDISVKENVKGYDYLVMEEAGYGETYNAIKNEIEQDPDADKVLEWYMGMFQMTLSNDAMSQEYWSALTDVANAYYEEPFTIESFMEFEKDGVINVSVYAVDDETYADIAKHCGADADIINDTDKDSVLLYQNLEISTDNYRFEERKPTRYRYYELTQPTNFAIGDTMEPCVYDPKQEKQVAYPMTVAGFVTNEELKDYMTFHGGNTWVIMRTSTAQKINRLAALTEDPTADGNSAMMGRELYVKLKNTDGDLAQKLDELAIQRDEEPHLYVTVAGNSFEIESVAGTIALIIDIVAVCFILFSSFICLLNLFNSIRGRAEMRKTELAMLRSIGMSLAQMNRMLFLENVGLLLSGVLWSFVISMPIVYGIKWFLTGYFGNARLHFSVGVYVAGILITAISILFVSRYCYRTLRYDNILENIKNENV